VNLTRFKCVLAGTTALAGIVLCTPAIATTFTVSSATSSTQHLGAGDNLAVTNTGSITVVGAGDVSVAHGVVAGTITNAGMLSSDNDAIVVSTSADIAGGIINQAGGIIAGGTANSNNGGIGILFNANVSGGIDNSSSITGRSGIRVLSSNISGAIVNRATGIISGATSQGIYLQHSILSGGLDNSGTISGGTSNVSAGLLIDSNSGISGTFINRVGGDISAHQWGIDISGGDISGGITNLGKIHATNYGITVRGSNSDISGGINNAGTISGIYAIYVQSGAKISGGILNSGTIRGLGTAIYLSGLSETTPITLDGGQIIGDVIDTTPGKGFSPVTVDSDFTTHGNFSVSSIEITSGHTLTVSNGNTIAEKTLTFDVDNTSNFGKLVISNGAINLTGVAVKINASIGATLAIGDEIMIGDGSANIAGGPGGTKTAVVDNTSAFDFQIADGTAATTPTDATDLFLFVVPNGTNPPPPPPVTPLPGDPFLHAYNVLTGLDGDGISALQTAIDAINSAGAIKQIDNIVSSVSPTVDGAAWRAAEDEADAVFDLTNQRLDEPEEGHAGTPQKTGASAGNGRSGLAEWGEFFGQAGDQGARDGIAGYSSNVYGFALGVEANGFARSAAVGIAASYGRTNADSRNANTTSLSVDSYQLTLYANHDMGDEAYLRGMIGYAYDHNTTDRHNVGGAGGPTASGVFAANQFAGRAEAGRHLNFGCTVITPSLLANWLHYDSNGYTEKGAGGGDLNVQSARLNLLELGGGIKAGRGWKNKDGDAFLPEIRAGYRYDLIGDRVQDTSSFTGGGGSFSLQGPKPARSRFNLGAGFTYQTAASWDFRANYDYDVRRDYHAHAGTLRATYKF
jgi:uncharacterized protein with beta-barrel porin domain